jgi:hypothetical protein
MFLYILESTITTDLPVKLIETVPIAAALIYVVVVFLRSIDKRSEVIQQMQKDWSASLEQTMENVVSSITPVIDRNTNALIENKAIIEHCRMAVTPK